MRHLIPVLLSVFLFAPAASGQLANPSFTANLSGAGEVPAVKARATGQAFFQLSASGTELGYKLVAARIEDVTQAHMHLGPAGENGPIVVWLYPQSPPPQVIPGRFDGDLSAGVITSASLLGPLIGKPLDDLLAEIRAGNAFVNVHTSRNPAGEIRGRVLP